MRACRRRAPFSSRADSGPSVEKVAVDGEPGLFGSDRRSDAGSFPHAPTNWAFTPASAAKTASAATSLSESRGPSALSSSSVPGSAYPIQVRLTRPVR